ncbi:uncharacterized protein TNCV_3470881 [Trichonephila clavipes]|nr:uncharacterized protein TNCV_3470881 [Trichonephila clavipes]
MGTQNPSQSFNRSTDEEPLHHFGPIGDTSWCEYQKAVATNSAYLFKHKNIVPIALMDEIKPIIAELSAAKLQEKCVWGKTQYANVSFNSTVWKYYPKLLCGSSKNIVDIAVNEATVMFNEGMTRRIRIMKALGFKIGHFAVTSACKANYARIKNAEIKSKSYTLEVRRARRMRKKATNEHFAELEVLHMKQDHFK